MVQMNMAQMKRWWLTLAVFVIAEPLLLGAQLRLHDRQRDAIAQEALKQAESLSSADVWARQARNLQKLSENDLQVMLEAARVRMRSRINALRTWSDAEEIASDAKRSAAALPPSTAPDFQAQKEKLNSEIKKLKEMVPESALAGLADRIGDIEDLFRLARELGAKDIKAFNTAEGVINKLNDLYGEYQKQMAAVDKAVGQLNDLKIEVKKALLLRLQVEERYQLSRAAIVGRRERELEPVRTLIPVCHTPSRTSQDERIADTLARLQGDDLGRAVRSLYACAALASRGQLADDLASIRMAQLEHLRSIQLSAANARVYEAVLGGGVTRLALFYQGGVKPETIAQIGQALATAGIFGKFLSE